MIVNANSTTQARSQVPLKTLGLLLCASFFASISTIVYGSIVTRQAIALPEILLIAGSLCAIVTAPLASLGLWSRSKQSIEDSSFVKLLIKERWLFALFLAIGLGSLCGIFVILSDKAFNSLLPAAIQDIELPGSLPGLFAALGAGINEEIWFRLGILTGLVGLERWLLKQTQTSTGLFWAANVVSSLLFGAAHLPQFALMAGGFSFGVIGVVLLQNGVVGLTFGWLYWQWGLLAAMLAHIVADVVIHVLVPTFFR
jgi:membrane protease YdiL (CAAX protease family)